MQYRKSLGRVIAFSLILNSVIPLIASIIQLFAYGLSLTNMSLVGMIILLYLFVLIDLNETVERAKNQEIDFYKKEREQEHDMFEQTAEALASAIDAKDPYTNGHSRRVAEYSLKIAKSVGKPEEECERVYFAALLHDVGKIGVPSSIINKKGRLTDEEFEQIKRHPVLGGQILSTIRQSPWLSIGARYHHERYGGRGYPEGLKGEEIPEIACIIAVAGWNAWKDENKKGLDCVVKIQRNGNVITMQTENLGIAIGSVTTILDDVKDVYVSLTGDQCAITNIHVLYGMG